MEYLPYILGYALAAAIAIAVMVVILRVVFRVNERSIQNDKIIALLEKLVVLQGGEVEKKTK